MASTLELRKTPGGLDLLLDGVVRIAHRAEAPFLSAGRGRGHYEMHRGNFRIREDLEDLVALREAEVLSEAPLRLRFHRQGLYPVEAAFGLEGGRLVVAFSSPEDPASPRFPNRLRLRLPAAAGEEVYGCGEQFSHFALRGRHFPLWTSEQGVGRNKLTEITRLADADDGAGGDYYWTFYPQASFVSTAGYWCHLETWAWADFDFRAPDRHELYAWDLPRRLVLGDGRAPGQERAALDAGVPVTGIWAQDWEGINMTSFGQRLRWNWVHDEDRYPGLREEIPRLRARGIRFLGYINPYVGAGMSLFAEAAARGYLAKDTAGADYLVEFGEFYAGIVDLTNPAAFGWYKGVIKANLIGFGLSGWMADFGEYLPTDAVLFDGRPADLAHNEWPALWARCNREAVDEAVAEGLAAKDDIVYFMRAGAVGSQVDCPLMWAGDQNVDWSEDDGLPSVIPAALSLAMSGHGLHHADLGGYTTLYGMRRSKELLLRWAEQAALSPVMRSHEGNRPKENWQFDGDRETLERLGDLGRLHHALLPYLRALVAENADTGLPVMRPLFLHFPEDGAGYGIKDEYLLGPDLLVAPVLVEGATSRTVHIPEGSWIELWTGRNLSGGDREVPAPLGRPPLFARQRSPWLETFQRAIEATRRT